MLVQFLLSFKVEVIKWDERTISPMDKVILWFHALVCRVSSLLNNSIHWQSIFDCFVDIISRVNTALGILPSARAGRIEMWRTFIHKARNVSWIYFRTRHWYEESFAIITRMCKQCVPGALSPPPPGNEAMLGHTLSLYNRTWTWVLLWILQVK